MTKTPTNSPRRSTERRRTGELTDPPPLILLVGDNPDDVSIYTRTLELEGYAVMSAVDGATGLTAARTSHPTLIALDLSLRGMSGSEVARILKADPSTASIPILVLGAAPPDTRAAGAADAFLPKPADPAKVIAEVRRLLQR